MNRFDDLAKNLFHILLNTIWMDALIIGMSWIALRFASKVSAAFRSVVWNRVMLLVLVLPLVMAFIPDSFQVARLSSASEITNSVSLSVSNLPSHALPTSHSSIARFLALAFHFKPQFGRTTSTVTVVLWSLGTLALLMRVLIGHLVLGAHAKTSAVELDSDWSLAREEAARRLQISAPLQLVPLKGVAGPSIHGFRRPQVFLPQETTWSLERKRIVLLHEFAHLKRGDAFSLLLQEIVSAIYWFNPLVTWVAKEARQSCEQACDDLVLTAGIRPLDYASHLFDISLALGNARGPSHALGLLSPNALEMRLKAILNPALRRNRPGVVARALTVLATIPVVLTLSAFRPHSRVMAGSSSVDSEASTTSRALGLSDSYFLEQRTKIFAGGSRQVGTVAPGNNKPLEQTATRRVPTPTPTPSASSARQHPNPTASIQRPEPKPAPPSPSDRSLPSPNPSPELSVAQVSARHPDPHPTPHPGTI